MRTIEIGGLVTRDSIPVDAIEAGKENNVLTTMLIILFLVSIGLTVAVVHYKMKSDSTAVEDKNAA